MIERYAINTRKQLMWYLNKMHFFFFLCFITIFILATMPLKMPMLDVSFADKLNRIVAFVVLFIFFYTSYNVKIWLTISFLLGYGLLIECIQNFLPYRDFSWFDVMAAGIGLVIGVLVKNFIVKFNRFFYM